MVASINTDSVELILKQGFIKKNLIIDRFGITYGKKYIPFSEIVSLRYGSTKISVHGIPSSITYNFDFLDATQKKFRVIFSAVALSKSSVCEAEENNLAIIGVLWKYQTSKIVNEMIKNLNANRTVKVGNFEVERNGIRITYRKFFIIKREVLLPWKDCLKGVGPGYLYIKSASNKKVIAKSMFLRTWDLNALYSLLNYLWADGKCYVLERGEKI